MKNGFEAVFLSEFPVGSEGSAPPFLCFYGVERRTNPAEYVWDGMRRRISKSHPLLVYQHTLRGRGLLETDGRRHVCEPGSAFVACLPSPHVYCLPEDSEEWVFAFFVIDHGYLFERFSERCGGVAGVVRNLAGGALEAQLLRAWRELSALGEGAAWRVEGLLFRLFFAWRAEEEGASREDHALLAWAKAEVLKNLPAALSTSDLAQMRGLTRSHFAHEFRAKTGFPPGGYLLRVRLEKARALLRTTREKLENIAPACGFSDANHLCKVFRRMYHMTPGEYRRGWEP